MIDFDRVECVGNIFVEGVDDGVLGLARLAAFCLPSFRSGSDFWTPALRPGNKHRQRTFVVESFQAPESTRAVYVPIARGPTEGPIGAPSLTGPRTAGTPTLAMSSAVARAAALDCTALTCSTTVYER